MVSKSSRLDIYFNKELKEKLLQNFQTDNIKDIQKIVLEFLENGDSKILSLKDQLLLEKLSMLQEQRPFKLRILEAQADILEAKRKFLYNFKSVMSDSGSETLSKSTYQKYGFATSPNIDENIQLKKNFYVNPLGTGEYCGCCKVCQNFSTAICSTYREAEGDIELHLELVHQTGLFQR